MAITREAILAIVVISGIVASVAGFSEDGLPRPSNVPDAPTITYGPEPEVKGPNGATADCTWYGFANEQYDDSIGDRCLKDLRAVLTNATAGDMPLEPYVYYFFSTGPTGCDPVTKEPYCFEGCFNLNGGALPPSYFNSPPAPGPDRYIRGPALAPYYEPGSPPMPDNIAPAPYFQPGCPPIDGNIAPAPESGA